MNQKRLGKNLDIRFIDLFAGMGGFRLGFENACAEIGINPICVFTSDIKNHAVKTYQENFGEEKIQGDITEIDEKSIPSFDVLLAGFPCQAFSSAGNRQGFQDTRGTLFFEIERILRFHKPESFILENVEGLVNHQKLSKNDQIGETLIENDLDDNTKTAPSTDEKILYNNIINYKPTIEEYSIYQGKLNNIYEEIENQGSTKKAFLLQNIKTLYLKEKGKYKDISEIRANADLIFENIENEIWEILEGSSNLNSELPIETLNIAILIVMVDAFMRCKILEEPIMQ